MKLQFVKGERFSQVIPVNGLKPTDKILLQATHETNLLGTLATNNYGGSDDQILICVPEGVKVDVFSTHLGLLPDQEAHFRLIRFDDNGNSEVIAEGDIYVRSKITETVDNITDVQPDAAASEQSPDVAEAPAKRQKGNK